MHKLIVPLGSLVAALSIASIASLGAQTPPGPRERGPGMRMDPAEREDMRLNMMASNLGLSEDQKRQFRETFDEGRRTAAPLQQQITSGRQELIQAMRTGRPQADIERLTASQGSLLAQMTAVEARTIAKLYGILTPEQQPRADRLFMRMPGMLLFVDPRNQGNPEMEKMGHGPGDLRPGDLAPDFDLKRLKSTSRVRLSEFANRTPVALVFGSYT